MDSCMTDHVFTHSRIVIPVSYTHLDVYKRQGSDKHQEHEEDFTIHLRFVKEDIGNGKMCIRDSDLSDQYGTGFRGIV